MYEWTIHITRFEKVKSWMASAQVGTSRPISFHLSFPTKSPSSFNRTISCTQVNGYKFPLCRLAMIDFYPNKSDQWWVLAQCQISIQYVYANCRYAISTYRLLYDSPWTSLLTCPSSNLPCAKTFAKGVREIFSLNLSRVCELLKIFRLKSLHSLSYDCEKLQSLFKLG